MAAFQQSLFMSRLLADLNLERHPMPDNSSYAFTWACRYEGGGGAHVLEMTPAADRSMSLVLLRIGRESGVFFKDLADHACRLLSESAVDREPGHVVLSGALHQRLVLDGTGPKRFPVLLPNAGDYMLFTRYPPAEFALRISGLKLLSQRQFEHASKRERAE
jgi:hypothetical protein